MEAETRLSLLNQWLYNVGFVDPHSGRVRNPFGFLRAEDITDPQLFEDLLIIPEELTQKLTEPSHGVFLGQPGSGRTTLARYLDHQLGERSLGIHSDVASVHDAAFTHPPSDQTGDFFLIVDQQQACLLDEISYFLAKLQRASMSGLRIWAKLFLPQANTADAIAELPPATQARSVQELTWSAEGLREVLLQRVGWASDWRINEGLNPFSTEDLIFDLGGDVNRALAERVRTPRDLLRIASHLAVRSIDDNVDRLGHEVAIRLSRDAWRVLTQHAAQSTAFPGRVGPPPAPPTPDNPAAGVGRPALMVEMVLDSNQMEVSIGYGKHRLTPGRPQVALPYAEKYLRVHPLLQIVYRALNPSFRDSACYQEPGYWTYLEDHNLVDAHTHQVKTSVRQDVGKALWRVLSEQQDFAEDLKSSNFAADIQLSLQVKDGLLASYPWELIASWESLLLKEVGLTRHLAVEHKSAAGLQPLRVLYVAPRPVLSADTWPGSTAGPTSDVGNGANRFTPGQNTPHVFADPDFASVRTKEQLIRRLATDPTISALHFDGHVVLAKLCIVCNRWVDAKHTLCPTCDSTLPGDPQPLLAFERGAADRTVEPVAISDLERGTAHWTSLALVVLFACNSATPADTNRGTTGAAQALLMAGARCAVGMQAPVYDVPVIRQYFVDTLYEHLDTTGSIATAMRAVRKKLENTGAWWMPVVYLRVDDDAQAPLFKASAG